MSKAALVLATALALGVAACGQLNQGKAGEAPAEGSAAPADATADGKPAEAAGDAANKPEATTPAPAAADANKPS